MEWLAGIACGWKVHEVFVEKTLLQTEKIRRRIHCQSLSDINSLRELHCASRKSHCHVETVRGIHCSDTSTDSLRPNDYINTVLSSPSVISPFLPFLLIQPAPYSSAPLHNSPQTTVYSHRSYCDYSPQISDAPFAHCPRPLSVTFGVHNPCCGWKPASSLPRECSAKVLCVLSNFKPPRRRQRNAGALWPATTFAAASAAEAFHVLPDTNISQSVFM